MTRVNIKDYSNLQQRRLAILRKGKRRGPITAAKFMTASLRKLAPINTGNVRDTIHRKKSSVRVSGINPVSGFPYIHWINATPGMGLEKVRLVYPFGDGTSKRFIDVARVPSSAGFFWTAQRATRNFYRESMLRVTRNALLARG